MSDRVPWFLIDPMPEQAPGKPANGPCESCYRPSCPEQCPYVTGFPR